ncbi:MAG: hypothetical protein VB013_04960 [Anaerolineaceae bacterium]|nr:hypothetical protein [Anaerolineaceae bacterium]
MKTQQNRRTKFHSLMGLVVILLLGMMLSACLPTDDSVAETATVSAMPTSTFTATVDWFPATATPTIVPADTATPNPAATPVYGSLIFSDPFSGNDPWVNEQNGNGYVIVKEGALSLAIKAEKGSLFTFRNNTMLTNYYLETTVNVGLCKGDDQLGVLFRVNGSQSFYRFLINCQGMVSLQQVAGGTPVVLVDWAPGSVSAGLYQPITIGVWQSGSVIRIYINGILQFEATSDYYKSGGIGFYAHADSDTPLTVNFTSLNVFEVARTSTATPTP